MLIRLAVSPENCTTCATYGRLLVRPSVSADSSESVSGGSPMTERPYALRGEEERVHASRQ